MSHWLEEAERKQNPVKENISRADRIRKRYLKIQENVKNNGNQFDEFTKDLHNLIDRVNKLPANQARPFRKMEGRVKASKLNNHLNIFSSSRRIDDRKIWNYVPFFRLNQFKHFRVFFISISGKDGMCEIELKENQLRREVIGADKKNHKLKPSNSGKFHVIYSFPISHLDHELALEVIDWLAFVKGAPDCTFYNSVNEEARHFIK